jgi:hypothetical protein
VTDGLRDLVRDYATEHLADENAVLVERFRPDDGAIETRGNVLTATAFLYGLALEELERADLDVDDTSFPVTVAARAAWLYSLVRSGPLRFLAGGE